MSRQCPSKSESPAPPPCEAPLPNVAEAEELALRLEAIPGCLEGMPGGYGTWAPASAAEYIRRQALVILAQSEEIAELRALLVRIRNWRMDPVQVNYSLWFLDENGHPTRTLVEAIDAALAPKEVQ